MSGLKDYKMTIIDDAVASRPALPGVLATGKPDARRTRDAQVVVIGVARRHFADFPRTPLSATLTPPRERRGASTRAAVLQQQVPCAEGATKPASIHSVLHFGCMHP